jgi:hypothetical protein
MEAEFLFVMALSQEMPYELPNCTDNYSCLPILEITLVKPYWRRLEKYYLHEF